MHLYYVSLSSTGNKYQQEEATSMSARKLHMCFVCVLIFKDINHFPIFKIFQQKKILFKYYLHLTRNIFLKISCLGFLLVLIYLNPKLEKQSNLIHTPPPPPAPQIYFTHSSLLFKRQYFLMLLFCLFFLNISPRFSTRILSPLIFLN